MHIILGSQEERISDCERDGRLTQLAVGDEEDALFGHCC